MNRSWKRYVNVSTEHKKRKKQLILNLEKIIPIYTHLIKNMENIVETVIVSSLS